MVNEVVQKLITYIIPIIVLILLIIVFFGPEKGFTKLKEITSKLPDVKIGLPQTTGEKPVLPEAHAEAINNLKKAIDTMADATKSCFYLYNPSFMAGNGFPLLREKGTSIILTKETGGTRLTVKGGIDGLQEISSDLLRDSQDVPLDVSPCVISGVSSTSTIFKERNTIPQDFYNTWIEPTDYEADHYLPVQTIEIKTIGDENKIQYNNGGFLDFNDGGFVYTPDDKHICFFPTKRGNPFCDGDGELGLDDDCLGFGDKTEGDNLLHLAYIGQLPWCA